MSPKPEHVGHRIEAGCLAVRPLRGLQGTMRKDHPVFRMMSQRDALIRTSEDDAVISGHGAAAERGKTDIARLAGAGEPVASARRVLIQHDLAAAGRRLPQHQRRAGGRIDLGLVMHFENFDIEILVQRLRHPLHQRGKQIDPQTYIARLHNDGLRSHTPDDRHVRRRQTGGTDDMHKTALGRDGDVRDGRGRTVKSRIPSAFADSDQRSADTSIPFAVRPARTPASFPINSEPGASSAPVSTAPPVSVIARTKARPIRPPAPATIKRISVMFGALD